MTAVPSLSERLELRYPIVCAPLFLISNVEMMLASARAGILGGVPALNYRSHDEFRGALKAIRSKTDRAFAVNLIVHSQYNPRLEVDFEACIEYEVPALITAFGTPASLIDRAHEKGMLVFHDAIKLKHAKKAAEAGVDAVIAVSGGAGGHAGTISPFVLWPWFKKELDIPVIAAGGIATGAGVAGAMALGADLAYVGTRFIASPEAQVQEDYVKMILESSPEDIEYSSEVSGTHANWLKPSLDRFRTSETNDNALARWKDVWSAGHAVGLIDEAKSIEAIVEELVTDYEAARQAMPKL